MYSDAEREVLKRYVTDVDGDVYAIRNLPEEVIAVIFAYVSRSSKSFRDNLLELIRGRSLDLSEEVAAGLPEEHRSAQETARRFHEKWVVGYGHSSVAEHAVAHVGVERISRLASAELELANPYLSFTEYSQRYQRPLKGGFVVPAELEQPVFADLKAEFRAFCDFAFERYEELQAKLLEHLLKTAPQRPGEGAEARHSRLEKLSFEDARYALPLAVHTNLGLTGNGRAIRDALVRLLSSGSPEVRRLAESLRREVALVLPALLRHAEANPYWQAQQAPWSAPLQYVAQAAAGREEGDAPAVHPGEAALLDYTGRDAAEGAAEAALERLLIAWLARRAGLRGGPAERALAEMGPAQKRQLYSEALRDFADHDLPAEELRQVRYTAQFVVSEANWHQLLRHSRKVAFFPAPPGIGHGFTLPPRIAEAGLTSLLVEAVERAEVLFARLEQAVPGAAAYAVTNAHRRPVLAEFDLWEWVHLARMRCKPDAQWDIRDTMWQLRDEIDRVHGPLTAPLQLPIRTAG